MTILSLNGDSYYWMQFTELSLLEIKHSVKYITSNELVGYKNAITSLGENFPSNLRQHTYQRRMGTAFTFSLF